MGEGGGMRWCVGRWWCGRGGGMRWYEEAEVWEVVV